MVINLAAALLSACLASAQAAPTLNPEKEKLLNEAVVNLYSLDYEQSRANFRKMIELDPENPFGYLFESAGIWWQSSQEFGLFKDTPTLEGLFEHDSKLALKKADILIKSDDDNKKADGHFVAGMTLGAKGQWDLLRRRFLKACFDGRKAVKHLNKSIKIDPNYNDAYLGLGIYDYQAARLPGVLKVSSMLCGAHGDEKRGLARMHLAMEKGRYTSRQATAFLASIYITDQRDYSRALTLVRKLRQDFPNSPYFQFLDVALRHRLGDAEGSLKEAKDLFTRVQADFPNFKRKLLTLFCGFTADRCMDRENVEMGQAWFNRALASKAKGDSEAWISFNHLYLGHAEDVLGNREEAVKNYRQVLAGPDFSDFHSRAQECLAKPCGAAPLARYLSAMSQNSPWPPPSKKP